MAENTLTVFDEVVKGEKGQLRIVVEYPKTPSQIERYFAALKDARNIPFDLEAINPLDQMYRFVKEKFPKARDDAEYAKAQVQFFYKEQARQAERDAAMLAMTSHKDNVFDEEPVPYKDDDFSSDDDLPGLVATPQPTRNLDNGVERRLKQIYDFLQSDPTLLIPFIQRFELAAIQVNNMLVAASTDDAGFQPATTGSAKNKRPVRSDLQPQA